jgi:ABC-type uncharacterized transport system fused permease/ATPase subunit
MGLFQESNHTFSRAFRLQRELLMLSGQLNRVAGLLDLTERLSKEGLCAAVQEEEGGRVVAFDGVTVRSPSGATLIEGLSLSIPAGGEVRAAARAQPFPGEFASAVPRRGP